MAHFEETAIGFKAIFQKTFNDTKSEADILAMRVNSNSLSEKYVWLGNFPMMKEWVGDRDIKKFKDYGYAIENQLFEATVTVPNTHLEYDKVGLYKPAIEQMAFNAKNFGAKLIADILLNAESSPAYDGVNFYAANHQIGGNTYENLTNLPLTSDNLVAAEAFMMSIKGDTNQCLGVSPTHLVCGPKNLAVALDTIDSQYLNGGKSNPTYKRYTLVVLPEITDTSWHLLDLSKPVKPFVLQVAKDGLFEASNDHHFMKDAALFGCKSFMNAGYGLWQLAYKSTGV